MDRQDAVLLPHVISPNIVRIGQFLCNPLRPERNNFVPKADTIKKINLDEPQPRIPYHGTFTLDNRGWFKILLSKAFGASLFGSSTTALDVTANESIYQGVKNEDHALRVVCEDPAVRGWIQDLALNGKPFYFVVGLMMLEQANFRALVSDQIGGQVAITVLTDGSGSLPVTASGGYGRGRFGFSEGGESGIFAMKLLKAKWYWLNKEDMPTWEDKVHWRFAHEKIKGVAQEEREIGLELDESIDFNELLELQDKYEKMSAPAPDKDDE